jgi:hypothetical protein
MAKAKTTPRGRSAETGKFIPVKQAQREWRTSEVERVPNPGYGITNRRKRT